MGELVLSSPWLRESPWQEKAASWGVVGSTPEVTPAPELEPDDSERQEEEDLPLELPPQEDKDEKADGPVG
jgi:hypothetical protein